MPKKISIESGLEKLNEIGMKLENGEETLEDSVKLYEEAMAILSYCKEILVNSEQKITISNEGKNV